MLKYKLNSNHKLTLKGWIKSKIIFTYKKSLKLFKKLTDKNWKCLSLHKRTIKHNSKQRRIIIILTFKIECKKNQNFSKSWRHHPCSLLMKTSFCSKSLKPSFTAISIRKQSASTWLRNIFKVDLKMNLREYLFVVFVGLRQVSQSIQSDSARSWKQQIRIWRYH